MLIVVVVVVVVVVVMVTIQLQVESVMKEAVVAQPMEASELLSLQDVDLGHLAKASASMNIEPPKVETFNASELIPLRAWGGMRRRREGVVLRR